MPPVDSLVSLDINGEVPLYAEHALVFNVPLNHRFFEVMAAGVPQVVFGDPGLVGSAAAGTLMAGPVL